MKTTQEKNQELEKEEKNRIFLYHLIYAKQEIDKGNQTIQMLYDLLMQEVNKHNGLVFRKLKKIREQPSSD